MLGLDLLMDLGWIRLGRRSGTPVQHFHQTDK
jgi:hypothetical protein